MKMRKFVYCAVFLLALLATGCGEVNRKTSGLPQIDVNGNYPEKEICLQDVAEVNYVPLETEEGFLLTDVASLEIVSSEGIVCVSDQKVLLFHSDGKVKSLVDKKGQGPGEYRYVHYVWVDWARKEVYIHDIHQRAMMVYSLDGTFKHQFDIDMRTRQNDLLCDDEGHIVLYKEKPGRLEHGKVDPPYRPVVLISKEDGKIDSLSHQQDYYTTMSLKAQVADGNAWSIDIPVPALAKLNGEVYVSEVASDTIYRLNGMNLEPFMTRVPSVKDSDGEKFLLLLQGITPRHYYFRLQARELLRGSASGMTVKVSDDNSKELMYDTETGETFCPKFTNRECSSERSYDGLTFDGCDANTAYLILEAYDLIESLEAGELSGRLKNIAEGLKEDSNPVLMVVKFKE